MAGTSSTPGAAFKYHPNTADAKDATAVQSAAHSPSDSSWTMLIAARRVSRKTSPWLSSDEPLFHCSPRAANASELNIWFIRMGNRMTLPAVRRLGGRARQVRRPWPRILIPCGSIRCPAIRQKQARLGLRSLGRMPERVAVWGLIAWEAISPRPNLGDPRLVSLWRQVETERPFRGEHIDHDERSVL
jgi:hypothetical protein